MVQLARLELA